MSEIWHHARRVGTINNMKSKSKRGAATRKKILDSAAKLIGKRGVNGTSVDDILKDSSTGKSQFYHYFGSKDLMVRDLIDHWSEATTWISESRMSEITTKNQLVSWVDGFNELYQGGSLRNGCPIGNLASEVSIQSNMLKEKISEVLVLWTSRIAASLETISKNEGICSRYSHSDGAKIILSSIQGALVLAKAQSPEKPFDLVKSNIINALLTSPPTSRGLNRRSGARVATEKRRGTPGFCP
jgi:TetR/AcrR family transcriptional regulator, transcriptional repressor for nem operon